MIQSRAQFGFFGAVWAGIVAVSVANAVLVLLGYRVIHSTSGC